MHNSYKRDETRELVVTLNVFLANTAIVYYKTHGFHWNVEGENFYSLHLMFEKFYTKLWKSMDEVAERIRALGDKVPGNYTALLQHATIGEQESVPKEKVMLQILRDDYFSLAENAYKICAIASDKGDLITTDMMTKKAAFLEKAAWMLNSTLIN